MKLSPAEFSRVAKALADPQRCEILERAAACGELKCAVIVAELPISQATISHHLKELTQAGLLSRRKEGSFAHYRFCAEVMAAYVETLEEKMGLRKGPSPQAAHPGCSGGELIEGLSAEPPRGLRGEGG